MDDPTLPTLAPPAPTSPPAAAEISAAAAAAVCSDPAIAELLRRKSAGEKLTASEHGRIGNWKQRARLAALSGPAPLPPGPGRSESAPAPSAVPGLAPVADPAALLSPGDADLVRGTVAAVLGKLNAIGQRHLLAAAKAAGADAETLRRFSTAEVVGEDDRKVLSETAPLVAAGAGMDPRKIPVYAFLGTLASCGVNFYQAIAELKELQAAKATAPKA